MSAPTVPPVNPRPAPVKTADTWESVAVASGLNVKAAKRELARLDGVFGGQYGNIPEGALSDWVAAHFDTTKSRLFFMALGRIWERDIAAALPADRQKERGDEGEWIKARDAKNNAERDARQRNNPNPNPNPGEGVRAMADRHDPKPNPPKPTPNPNPNPKPSE